MDSLIRFVSPYCLSFLYSPLVHKLTVTRTIESQAYLQKGLSDAMYSQPCKLVCSQYSLSDILQNCLFHYDCFFCWVDYFIISHRSVGFTVCCIIFDRTDWKRELKYAPWVNNTDHFAVGGQFFVCWKTLHAKQVFVPSIFSGRLHFWLYALAQCILTFLSVGNVDKFLIALSNP